MKLRPSPLSLTEWRHIYSPPLFASLWRLPPKTSHPRPLTRRLTMDGSQWSPPEEPLMPPIPYLPGRRFTIRRVIPPPPFAANYWEHAPQELKSFFEKNRGYSEEDLKSTTKVDLCRSITPLPCRAVDEWIDLDIVGDIAIGDDRRSQLVVAETAGSSISVSSNGLVAKIYDPLYGSLESRHVCGIPTDIIETADAKFTCEAAAYTELDPRLGGSVILKYYGSWKLELLFTTSSSPRTVYLILMEKVPGIPLARFNPETHTSGERLNVLAKVLEADTAMDFAGVDHRDLAPRNIICDRADFRDPDLEVRVIDLDVAQVYRLLGFEVPCLTHSHPVSPIERHWDGPIAQMEDWADDELLCEDEAWIRFLRSRW